MGSAVQDHINDWKIRSHFVVSVLFTFWLLGFVYGFSAFFFLFSLQKKKMVLEAVVTQYISSVTNRVMTLTQHMLSTVSLSA